MKQNERQSRYIGTKTSSICLAFICFYLIAPAVGAEKIGINRAPQSLEEQSTLSTQAERQEWVKTVLSERFNLSKESALHTTSEQQLHSFKIVAVNQTYKNIPVVNSASRLVLNAQHQPIYILGTHSNIEPLEPATATFNSEQALSTLNITNGADVASRLVYWPSSQGQHILAYEFEGEFSTSFGYALSQRVFVNATTGKELDREPLFHTAMHRQINNFSAACEEFKVKFPLIPPLTDRVEARAMKTHARTEGSAPSNDDSVETAFALLGNAYEFMDTVLGMDSIDGNGLRLNMFINVHFLKGMPTIQCYGDVFNAMWMSRKQSLYVPKEGLNYIEITMHELAHGIVSNGSNLEYSFQSGALNESIADSIGIAFRIWLEHANKQTNSTKIPREYWLLRMPSGPERDLADPSSLSFGESAYPDHMNDFLNWPIKKDRGGVHINSSIMNMAFFLMANGGQHPRHSSTSTVTGIGLYPAVHIVAQAASKLLVQNANFEDARFAYALAAEALHGKGSKEWVAVHQAMDAVGVTGAWSPPQEVPEPQPVPVPTPESESEPSTEPTPEPEQESQPVPQPTTPPPKAEEPLETNDRVHTSNNEADNNQLVIILILGSVGLCIALLALFKLKPAYSRSESSKGYSAENTQIDTSMGNSAASPNATPDNLAPRPSKQQKGNVNNSGSAAHQQASPYYLQSLEGNQKLNISSYNASKGEGFVIGRSLELVHLQLRDERISRRHLRIKSHSDYFTVEDLNSTHGTMLDGERLKAFLPASIKHGQLLRIADFSYVFKVS